MNPRLMACHDWLEKLDPYIDGELSGDEARELAEHLAQCKSCSGEALQRVQMKRAVQSAAPKFTPDPAFRARIQKQFVSKKSVSWGRIWFPAMATGVAVLLVAFILLSLQRNRRGEQQLVSELIDKHVATLASANPVDVVSTDRHTVKPWFQGKIPFTFNLPELQGSPFTLIGGSVAYLKQSPGAELIFRERQHQISVFIFQKQAFAEVGENEKARSEFSFGMKTWEHNDLRYFVISDAGPDAVEQLSDLIEAAN